MSARMSIDICSPPDREKLVAQIMYDHVQWAEVQQEGATIVLELYPRPDGTPWELPFDDAVAALQRAQKRLTGDATPTA